jgi:hypothetical protein
MSTYACCSDLAADRLAELLPTVDCDADADAAADVGDGPPAFVGDELEQAAMLRTPAVTTPAVARRKVRVGRVTWASRASQLFLPDVRLLQLQTGWRVGKQAIDH